MAEEKWYFDTKTGEVTKGKSSGWDTRMGPYDSEDAARQALSTAQQRTEAADAYDEQDDWDNED